MSEPRAAYGDACIIEAEVLPPGALRVLRKLALFHAAVGEQAASWLPPELWPMWNEAQAAVDALPREVVFPGEVR